MNAPLRGKLQPIVDRGHHLSNWKGAVSLGRKLGGRLIGAKVTSFQPHEVSLVIFGRISVFHPRLLCLDHQFLGTLSSLFELVCSQRYLWNRGRLIHPISTRVEAV